MNIVGTVYGGGYNCRTDTAKVFEGVSEGLWNKVSYHVPWIRQTAASLGEDLCS